MQGRASWWLAVGLIVLGLAALALRASKPVGSVPPDATQSIANAGTAEKTPPLAGAGLGAGVSADDAPDAAPAATTAPSPAVVPMGANAPLPPIDAPLAGVLDSLEARARRGDARAACRLAADLSRCGGLQRRRAMLAMRDRWQVPTDPRAAEQMVDAAARMELALEVDEQMCAGVDAARHRTATTWLLAAARGGHVPSMAAFVGGGWMYDPGIVHHADAVAAYAREAEAMARQVAEAGEPDVMQTLAQAFAGDPAFPLPLAEVVKPDPVLARALFGVAERNRAAIPAPQGAAVPPRPDPFRERLERLDARLTPAQREAALALQETLEARASSVRAAAARSRLPRVGSIQFVNPADCDR
jgi:hypothetical protein